jgi:hypothetical protein
LLVLLVALRFADYAHGETVSAGDLAAMSPDAGRVFGDMIGLQAKFAQGQPLDELNTFVTLGVRWVRDVVYWPDIEPAPGRYVAFPPAFQKRLDFYREHDIGLIFLLGYANNKAYPATGQDPLRPVDPQAFGRYARQVAEMLSREKVRFVLEIWNEPHNFGLRKLVGGSWNGKPPSPWVDHYVKMVAQAVAQVKDFDPQVTLLTDEDMWVLHYRFLDAGLPQQLDGFAVHPYTRYAPEIAPVDAYTRWIKPYTVVDADRSFGSAVRRLRQYGETRLGHEPQIWATEWGWRVGENRDKGEVTEQQQAAYLPRAFILAAAVGVRTLSWFSARDTVDGPMGLTDNQGRRRPSWYAFKAMAENLGDARLVKQLYGDDNPVSGLQAFLFRVGTHYRLVAWNVEGDPSVAEFPRSAGRLHIEDVLGRPLQAAADDSGTQRVAFAGAPIYVLGLDERALQQLQLRVPATGGQTTEGS